MKFIKFDSIYPTDYIDKKLEEESGLLNKMGYLEFHKWIISQRLTFSDYYSYNLSKCGLDAKEIFLDNPFFKKKCEKFYFGNTLVYHKIKNRILNLLRNEKIGFKEKLIEKIVLIEKPDIIFVREYVAIRSNFWEQFKSTALVVSRMDCLVPNDWTPHSFDLIYTNVHSYQEYFKSNRIKTLPNSNGFDPRILNNIASFEKKYDVTYIGGLGDPIFTERSKFFESILVDSKGNINFKWWGYKTGNFDVSYPKLSEAYMGLTAGIEMFNILAQSKIGINDFDQKLSSKAVNMRIYEVMGVGTFLLTRNSSSFENWKDLIGTYTGIEDCLEKIEYYLTNDTERELIAKKGQKFILDNYNYQSLMKILGSEIIEEHKKKFAKNG